MEGYLLFAWGERDALGGVWDLKGIYETSDNAVDAFRELPSWHEEGQAVEVCAGGVKVIAGWHWGKYYDGDGGCDAKV